MNDKYSFYVWNLVVDLLGKNLLYDVMWDVIKFMKKEGIFFFVIFVLVFGSYVIGDRVKEAFMTFEVMD